MERLSYKSKNTESTEGLRDKLHPHDRTDLAFGDSLSSSPSKTNKPKDLTQSQMVTLARLKVVDIHYQNLLIESEELDLSLIEKSGEAKRLSSRLQLQREPLKKLSEQIDKTKASLQTKINYIREYCEYLAKKLSFTNMSIFIEQKNLTQKQDSESKAFQKNLLSEIGGIERETLQTRRDIDLTIVKNKNLHNQICTLKQEIMPMMKMESGYFNRLNKREIRKLLEEHAKQEEEKDTLVKTEKEYRRLNQNLKFLLTVEEEHNNSVMIVERAIVMKETQKVMDEIYKVETAREYEDHLIPDLSAMLREKARENQSLLRRVEQKQRNLAELSQRLESKVAEFESLHS